VHRRDIGDPPKLSWGRALRSLPPVVYFVRMPDGIIKIGYSASMETRMTKLGGDLLALLPGTRDDERAHHERFAHCLDHGLEWFRPEPDLLAYVDTVREGLGLSRLTA
jgi:hypothetical protein